MAADPQWPVQFEAEKARLMEAFGGRFQAIEHFGSTAIAGLDAKPIIDMLGGVASMTEADALIEPLCQIGWDTSPAYNATLGDRRWLLRWDGKIRTHHLHLVVYGSRQWQERLQFRDCLRTRPDLATQYQQLKYKLATQHRDDREAYTEAKAEFVTQVLACC